MIVGEAEIQGQVKRAYELALVEGVTGPVSNRLFRDALAAGKRARSETAVSRANVSVSSVAVQLAAEFLGDLASRRVLVIGAGENAELTARALRERGVRTVFVANRRYDRALGLAQRFDGQAVTFDDLPAELEAADIVVSSTGAAAPDRGARRARLVVAAARGEPAAGAARPRRAARHRPGGARLPGHRAVRHGRPAGGRVAQPGRARDRGRRGARCSCEEEVERFERWLESLDVVPTITALRGRGDDVVGPGAARERVALGERSPPPTASGSRSLARAVVSRLLHEPDRPRSERSAGEDDSYRYVNALRELFSLDPPAGGRVRGAGTPR